uniref:GB1/RHD3-type G domain-containing protein n=1 Tax=Vombatus ursinus TaxID=29139 RepID=A0A4X2LLW1_VOMUR
MASGVPMEAPICLVEIRNRELMVNQQALWILTSITKPVVVVAIVGQYHTGKSYLMNRLAGKNTGKWSPVLWESNFGGYYAMGLELLHSVSETSGRGEEGEHSKQERLSQETEFPSRLRS